ncbi:hypothetical protein ACLB2K_071477 [Fragaria x ananassa]
MSDQTMHIAMYPWFAMGHLTSYLHISNKLAERGHKISVFIPSKTQPKLVQFNRHPDLISFISINVPHVDGLPLGTETTADIPFHLHPHLVTAMDLTRPQIEQSLRELNPNFVFYDFSYWLPAFLSQLGKTIKSVHYCTISPATVGYLISPERKLRREAPTSFPSSSIKLRAHEARGLAYGANKEYGRGITFLKRQQINFGDCDAIAFKTCRELEGPFCDYLETQLRKPVILAGPVVPEPPSSHLEEKWANWLGGFDSKTVIFCAFGSECILRKEQLQELLLGFELTGLPFFAALKPPTGVESIESALPQGFLERVEGKEIVYGGSLSEALVNECQLVLLPNVGDQIINARMMSGDLKVGVEVEKGDEDGLFSKEGVCKAVKAVIDEDSEVEKEVRANHAKWREFFSSKGLESSYIDDFVHKLHKLLR